MDRNKLYIADSKTSVFSLDGSYEDGFKPERIAVFGSIGAQYKTSGMAVLSGSRVILPSHPSMWVDSGKHKLLSVYDQTGVITHSFGAVEQYDDPRLTLNANIVCSPTIIKTIYTWPTPTKIESANTHPTVK